MDKMFEKSLFSEIEEFFSSQGLTIVYDDIDGKNVLVIEPDGDDSFVDCGITVNETDGANTSVSMLFTLAADLSADDSDKVDDILLYLNKYLTIGSFGLIKESGYFYFSCSYFADTAAQIEQVMKVFLMTWQISADTAMQGTQTVIALLKGERPASELMTDDSSIIQFD